MDCPRLRAFTPPLLVLAALTAFNPQAVRAQASSPVPRAAPSDPAVDAARIAFEALPEADRKAIQDALIWTGDYSGVADGAFGRQTYAAIAAYQLRARQQPSGILTPQARAALVGAAQQARATTGFTLVDDRRTGIRIGIPTKVLAKQDANPSGGSRWQSADGRVTLDTRLAPPEATLQSLYDRNVAIQTPGRVVSYKVLRPDFFVITGETATGKFYTRYSSGMAGLRGFSLGYDKALAPQIDRLVVAIANSFTPFPEQAAPAAVVPAPTADPRGQIKPRAPDLIGTGVVVGRRQVVTTAPVASCREVLVSGLKPRQITGRDSYVLEFAEDLKVEPLKGARGALADGSPVLIVGFVDDGGRPSLAALSGQALNANMLAAPLQPGASGAPVFDMQGALVALVGAVSSERRKIAGVVPAASYPTVPASDITGFVPALAEKGNEPAARKRGAADIVGSVKSALVPITCGP
jgi:peptidoglycan hydrolase-like protein with peptidoglycan-binding domain